MKKFGISSFNFKIPDESLAIRKFPLLSIGYTFHTPVGCGHAQWACLSPYKVLPFSFSFRPDEVHSSGWKLVFNELTVLFQRKSTSTITTTEWEIYINHLFSVFFISYLFFILKFTLTPIFTCFLLQFILTNLLYFKLSSFISIPLSNLNSPFNLLNGIPSILFLKSAGIFSFNFEILDESPVIRKTRTAISSFNFEILVESPAIKKTITGISSFNFKIPDESLAIRKRKMGISSLNFEIPDEPPCYVRQCWFICTILLE